MVSQKQLEGIRLWRAAEGDHDSLVKLGMSRREAQFRAAESIAAGELPTQILPAVRRTLQSVYQTTPKVTPEFTTRATVAQIDVDEQVNIFTFDDQSNIPGTNMGDQFVAGGLPSIGRREKYPEISLTASGKTRRASKIGEAFGIDWEAIVNSRGASINVIREAINAFGRHAGNQEEINVAKLLVNASGFTSNVTTTGFNITGNPDLTDPTKLQAAVQQAMFRQIAGVDAAYSKFVLLTTLPNVGIARQALASRTITQIPARTGTPSTTSSAQWESQLQFAAEVEVVGFRWLKNLWPGIGNGWLLVPVVDEGAGQLPALSSNYLEGYENPSLWIKDSNARDITGGEVNPEADGDFDSDAVMTKVRHVHGATFLWGDAIGYSNGTNT